MNYKTYTCMTAGCHNSYTYEPGYDSLYYCSECEPRPERPVTDAFRAAHRALDRSERFVIAAATKVAAFTTAAPRDFEWLVSGEWMAAGQPRPFHRLWWLVTGEWMKKDK